MQAKILNHDFCAVMDMNLIFIAVETKAVLLDYLLCNKPLYEQNSGSCRQLANPVILQVY